MKFLFFLLVPNLLIAQSENHFYHYTTDGKVIPISKIAKIGRISIFIISASWCGPCRGLKARLTDTKFKKENADFYYIEIADSHTEKQFVKSAEYQYWTKIEGLDGFPFVYICGFSSNIISKFPCTEDSIYEKIVATISNLNDDIPKFNSSIMFKYDSGGNLLKPYNELNANKDYKPSAVKLDSVQMMPFDSSGIEGDLH